MDTHKQIAFRFFRSAYILGSHYAIQKRRLQMLLLQPRNSRTTPRLSFHSTRHLLGTRIALGTSQFPAVADFPCINNNILTATKVAASCFLPHLLREGFHTSVRSLWCTPSAARWLDGVGFSWTSPREFYTEGDIQPQFFNYNCAVCIPLNF